jgi:hypothetical protein
MIVGSHIFGLPVEETLTSFAPMGAVGAAAVAYTVRSRSARLRRFSSRLLRFVHRRR